MLLLLIYPIIGRIFLWPEVFYSTPAVILYIDFLLQPIPTFFNKSLRKLKRKHKILDVNDLQFFVIGYCFVCVKVYFISLSLSLLSLIIIHHAVKNDKLTDGN